MSDSDHTTTRKKRKHEKDKQDTRKRGQDEQDTRKRKHGQDEQDTRKRGQDKQDTKKRGQDKQDTRKRKQAKEPEKTAIPKTNRKQDKTIVSKKRTPKKQQFLDDERFSPLFHHDRLQFKTCLLPYQQYALEKLEEWNGRGLLGFGTGQGKTLTSFADKCRYYHNYCSAWKELVLPVLISVETGLTVPMLELVFVYAFDLCAKDEWPSKPLAFIVKPNVVKQVMDDILKHVDVPEECIRMWEKLQDPDKKKEQAEKRKKQKDLKTQDTLNKQVTGKNNGSTTQEDALNKQLKDKGLSTQQMNVTNDNASERQYTFINGQTIELTKDLHDYLLSHKGRRFERNEDMDDYVRIQMRDQTITQKEIANVIKKRKAVKRTRTVAETQRALDHMWRYHKYPPWIEIMSHDTAVMHVAWLRDKKLCCYTLDESHMIKTNDSARTRTLTPLLTGATRVTLLTATSMDRPSHLYPQIRVLQPTLFPDRMAYDKRYCALKQYTDPRTGRQVYDNTGVTRKNLPELHQILENHILIRTTKNNSHLLIPNKPWSAQYPILPPDFSMPVLRKARTSRVVREAWQYMEDHGLVIIKEEPIEEKTVLNVGDIPTSFHRVQLTLEADESIEKERNTLRTYLETELPQVPPDVHLMIIDQCIVNQARIRRGKMDTLNKKNKEILENVKKLAKQAQAVTNIDEIMVTSQNGKTQGTDKAKAAFGILMRMTISYKLPSMLRFITEFIQERLFAPGCETNKLVIFISSLKTAAILVDLIRSLFAIHFGESESHADLKQSTDKTDSSCAKQKSDDPDSPRVKRKTNKKENKSEKNKISRVIRIDSTVSTAKRCKFMDCFQTEPECRVAVVGSISGGVSAEYTAANYAIFAEIPMNASDFFQNLGRLIRLSQKRAVEAFFLTLRDSLEENIWRMIMNKNESASQALDGCKANFQYDTIAFDKDKKEDIIDLNKDKREDDMIDFDKDTEQR